MRKLVTFQHKNALAFTASISLTPLTDGEFMVWRRKKSGPTVIDNHQWRLKSLIDAEDLLEKQVMILEELQFSKTGEVDNA